MATPWAVLRPSAEDLDSAFDTELVAEEFSPYRALWASVLTTAFADLDDHKQEIVQDAKAWLYSRETGPQSYIWICDLLGVDPDELLWICSTRQGRKILHKNNGRQRGHRND
jgi:hypothetical protein